MSGPKRNPDKLNTIGVVVVGICGAVMVYVSIIALQAFYMNDTSELQHTKDYGGLEKAAQSHKADEMRNISEAASNSGGATFRIPVAHAMDLVVEDAKKDPSHLIPSLPASTKATIEPTFGRPKLLGAAPAPEGGTPTPEGAGSGAGSAAAPAPTGAAAPQTPTGAGPTGAGASPAKDAAAPTAAGSAAAKAPTGTGAGSAAKAPTGTGAGSAAKAPTGAPTGTGAGSAAKAPTGTGAGSAAKTK